MAVFLPHGSAVDLSELLTEAAHDLSWHLEGLSPVQVCALCPLSELASGRLSFLSNSKYLSDVPDQSAGVLIVSSAHSERATGIATRVICDHPYLLFARIAQWFERAMQPAEATLIHPSAQIHPSAVVGERVRIAAGVVVAEGARLSPGVILHPGVVVGARSSVGTDSELFAHVVLGADVNLGARVRVQAGAIIGADGFGFAPSVDESGSWVRIPQLAGVEVGDDVDIGANTCIDRGALSPTRIGRGVIIDNLVQVAHNVEIGDFTAIAGCVGIAGSARIGARCTIGGGAVVLGHLEICDKVHISAATVVMSSIDRPGRYTGFWPRLPHKEWERVAASLPQLPALRQRIRRLESRFGSSESSTHES